jgi:predicted ATPase
VYISSIEVHNYKSYDASGRLDLTPGFNIITGQNSAGKTALLEALGLSFSDNPHRSTKKLPTRSTLVEPKSWVELTIKCQLNEMLKLALAQRNGFSIAAPSEAVVMGGHHTNPYNFTYNVTLESGNTEERNAFINWVFSQKEYTFKFKVTGGADLRATDFPASSLYKGHIRDDKYMLFTCAITPGSNKITNPGRVARSNDNNEIGYVVGNSFRSRIYSFRAERFNAGIASFGQNPVLSPNAQNLPEVLGILQGNAGRYRRYIDLVRQVLPQVQWVSVRPYANQNSLLEIVIWNEDPQSERDDLAVPLNESGTGINQVLAILYVLISSEEPRTIIIDEPQSFLHPGAVRKLIDILKEYKQHQFIIATHSPTIITAASPQTISVIKQIGPESVAETVDVAETDQLRSYLAEIGARLSDVFGADNVLWVEGKTEEICFPLILEGVANRTLMGTAIIGVQHTGDLEGKHAEKVFDIYERLTHGKGLLPPAVGFIFDKEGRTAQQQEDLKRKSGNRVHFTHRRLYENYLLNVSAITAVLNEEDNTRTVLLSENEVRKWLEEKGHNQKYGRVPVDATVSWEEYVHGANVLIDLFSALSNSRVNYDKVNHSVAITKWLIKNNLEELRELADLVERALDGAVND